VSISTEESHSHPPAEIANRATAASLVYVEDTGIDTPPDTDLTIESLDEKWGTDDDEKVLGGSNLDEDEDMDDIEIVSLPAPAENDNQIAICPVCSMRLLSFHLTVSFPIFA
jgi:hypothetical protein